MDYDVKLQLAVENQLYCFRFSMLMNRELTVYRCDTLITVLFCIKKLKETDYLYPSLFCLDETCHMASV